MKPFYSLFFFFDTILSSSLVAGLYAFKTGKSHQSQKMMRARVAAQGATIAVLAAGAFMGLKPGQKGSAWPLDK